MNSLRIGGIVLAGGRSTRMGTSKAWLPIDGEPMLLRAVKLVSEVVSQVVVAAAVNQELPPLPDSVRVVCDAIPDRGPLGGIAAAMAILDVDAVLVVACDLPRLTAATLRTLMETRFDDALAVVPVVDHQPQPLTGCYRAEVRDVIERHLAEGRWSLQELLHAIPCRTIEMTDPEQFLNVNSQEQYRMCRLESQS